MNTQNTIIRSIFQFWLRSIGAEIDEWQFTYKGQYHEFGVWKKWFAPYNTILDIGRGTCITDFVWLNLDFNVDVDICDPSFDPEIFFKPLKKWIG